MNGREVFFWQGYVEILKHIHVYRVRFRHVTNRDRFGQGIHRDRFGQTCTGKDMNSDRLLAKIRTEIDLYKDVYRDRFRERHMQG